MTAYRVAIAMLFGALSICPQTSAPSFEAASVKPSTPASAPGSEFNFAPGGGLAIRNGDLKGIIQMAFNIQDFQILGAPSWTNAEHYDIFAKAPVDPNSKATAAEQRDQARRMLQTLLVERYQMAFHRETRQMPTYILSLSKAGAKLEESKSESTNGGIRGRCGFFIGTNTGIGSLVHALSRELGSPVKDQTGLTGRYSFRVDYAPSGTCTRPQDAPEAPADPPSVFGALQEQLGLKLEAGKAPQEVVVIDRIDRPTAN